MNNSFSQLSEAGAHWLLAWSTVVLAVTLVMRFARPRRAGVRYAAWLVALFAGVLLAPMMAGVSPKFAWCDLVARAETPPQQPAAEREEQFVSWFPTAAVASRESAHMPSADTAAEKVDAASGADSPRLHGNERGKFKLPQVGGLLIAAWLVGVMFGFWRLSQSWRRVRRLIRESEPAIDGQIVHEFDKAISKLRLRRRVALAVHSEIATPVCVGGLRPTVVWPSAVNEQMSDRERAAAIAHELAHIRRYDDWVNLAAELWRAAAWFFLPVHWLVGCLRREQEFMCDDAAAAEFDRPQSYAQLLLNLSNVEAPASRLCMAFAGPGIKGRIRRLLDARLRTLRPLSRSQATALAIACAALLAAAGSVRLVGLAAQTPGADAELPAATPQEIGAKIAEAMKSYSRGYLEVTYEEDRNTNDVGGPGGEPVMVHFPGRFRWASDGTRWRGEFEGATTTVNSTELRPRTWSGGFDGKTHYHSGERRAGEWVLGEDYQGENIRLPEFFWTGHNEDFSKLLQDTRWRNLEQTSVDGYRCYTLVRENSNPDESKWRYELTVSPRQGFLPVRYKVTVDGRLIWEDQLFDFAQAEGGKWYPRRLHRDHPSLGRRTEARITRFEPNHGFGNDYFRFELPAGVGVFDYRAGYAYRNDPWWPEVKPILRERFNWPPPSTGILRLMSSGADKQLEDQPAPPLAVREWIHGGPIDLVALRGKVVLLYFSPPALIPSNPARTMALKCLYQMYHKSGLEIVEINPHSLDPSTSKQRVAELDIPWPVAVDSADAGPGNGNTFAAYLREAEIATVLIDHEGRVRFSPEDQLGQLCVSLLTAAEASDIPPLPTGGERETPEMLRQFRPLFNQMVDAAPTTAAIAGTVTADKAGLANARIEARLRFELNIGSEGTLATTIVNGPRTALGATNEDGTFNLDKLTKGIYDVTISAPGRARLRERVVVAQHDSMVRFDADLSQADGLAGRVVDELGVPIAGAVVRIGKRYSYKPDGTIGGYSTGSVVSGPATTDENGNFALEGLLTGAYELLVLHEKFGSGGVDEMPAGTKDLTIKLDPKAPAPVERGRGGRGARGPANARQSAAASPPAPASTVLAKPAQTQTAPLPPERTDLLTTAGRLSLIVVGPDGERVEGAKVHFNIVPDGQPIINRDVSTDNVGLAVSELPKTLDHLKLWVRKDGFVPQFAIWFPRMQPGTKDVPAEFTIQLTKGTTIGGIIQDEDGKPIEGAKVEVRLADQRRASAQEPRVSDDVGLATEQSALTTKADGRWLLDNVPSTADTAVRVKLTHPDYISDDQWGGGQGATMQTLRDQSAKLVMSRGVRITGTVKDASGRPLAGAVVVFGDDPEFQQGSQEVFTDAAGTYRTLPLREGTVNLTVVAAGFAPELRKVDITKGMQPADFSLRPGKTLRVWFVDVEGKPVPNVRVLVKGWRGVYSLQNGRQPEVASMRIPWQADATGKYEWTWAPEDEVIYNLAGYEVLAPDSAKVPYVSGSRLFRTALPTEVIRLTADGSDQIITVRRRR